MRTTATSTTPTALAHLKVPLGIGTMFWGDTVLDRRISGYVIPKATLAAICREAVAHNVTFFDTAEGYGGGTSEERLAAALRAAGVSDIGASPYIPATKFLPTLFRWTESAFLSALDASNRRMGVDCCPLFFIHSPVHPVAIETWVRAAGRAFKAGKLRALGLSNFNAEQVGRACREASRVGVPVTANQLMMNLMVWRSPELQRTLAACREHNLTVIAYAPLGQGLLADALTPDKCKNIRLSRMTGVTFDDLTALRQTLSRIAEAHGKTMAQVSTQWVVAKGAVPLVGVRKLDHLHQALGATADTGFRLAPHEVDALDACALGRHTFEKPRWRRSLFVIFISVLMLAYRAAQWLPRVAV